MPTLRSGEASIRLRIPVGQVLTIVAPVGSSAYVVHPIDMDPAATVSGATQSFGPFERSKTLHVTATAGDVSFSVDAPSSPVVFSEQTQKLYVGGKPIAAVGGGLPAKVSALSSTDILGDSIFRNGNNLSDASGGSTGGMFSDSSILYCNDRLSVPLDVIGWFAVGGKTTREVINEQVPLSLASPARIAYVHCGVNCLNTALGTAGSNQGWQATVADMAELVALLAPNKDAVIIDSIHPVLQSGTTNSKGRAGDFQRVNDGYKAIAAQYPNVVFVDGYSAIVDSTSVNNDARAGTVNTTDGIHFQSRGARLVGYAAAKAIEERLNLVRYRSQGSNLLPTLATATGGTTTPGGSGGAITSGASLMPSGWNLSIVTGNAQIAISRPSPTKVKLVMTAAATSVVYFQNIDSSGLAALLSAGDVIQAYGNFEHYNCSNMARLGSVVISRNSGATAWVAGLKNTSAAGGVDTAPVMPSGMAGNRCTPPLTVAAGTTSVLVSMGWEINAGGTCTVEFDLLELRKLG